MKLLILSDLHLELGAQLERPPKADFDAVVLAGDINNPGHKAVEWAARQFPDQPVLLVPGNHEFYGSVMDVERQRMRDARQGGQVYLLDRSAVVIEGVRFIGCTLWTDFQLGVQSQTGVTGTNIEQALCEANGRLNDFQRIEILAPSRIQYQARPRPRPLTAEDTLAWHWIERDWLRRALVEPFDGPTVVVTHHAPSQESVAPKYADDWLTPAFVSNLPDEFFEVPVLWVHGHTHTRFDYQRQGCRIVSNPRGYPLRDGGSENGVFDPALVLEVTVY